MSDMAVGTVGPEARAGKDPGVREVTVDDISAALAAGMRDFRAAPAFGLVFGGLYAVGGLAIFYAVTSLELAFLAYPLAAGFAIVAPLVAVALYEVSRTLEAGGRPTWGSILAAIPHHGRRELGFMALVAVFGLIIWVYAAGFLYALFFGLQPFGLAELVSAVVTTPRGIAFFVLGNVIGAFIALSLFAVSAVSYPLLLDRDVDFVTAMITSIRVVLASPGPMIGWGIFIGTLLGLAILPGFLGLFVILPMLGHATWHIYRRAVLP